jgi:uncharacterized protein
MEFEHYEKVSIKNVSLSNMGFVVFLKRKEIENVLPIFIGASEAHSISAAFNNNKLPRPLSHDLFKNILNELECDIQKIYITKLEEDTYYAVIEVKKGEEKLFMDARPSDAIALALRYKAQIFVNPEVLDIAAVNINDDELKPVDDKKPKGQLQVYKEAMEKAVASERYEDAAKLRDQIKNIQKHN